jgi:hypothetical protein
LLYSGISSEANITDDDKCGLIFSIISLIADVRMTEAVNFMVQILYNEIRYSGQPGSEHIYISANNAEGPEMTLESIQNELAKAVRRDEGFSYINILERIKAVCFNPGRICFFEYELGPDHVAQYFQVIIYNIVFTIYIYALLISYSGKDSDHCVQDD